jgi:hypothetical protein
VKSGATCVNPEMTNSHRRLCTSTPVGSTEHSRMRPAALTMDMYAIAFTLPLHTKRQCRG